MTPGLGFSYLLAHLGSVGVSFDRPVFLLFLVLLPAFFVWRGTQRPWSWIVLSRGAAYALVVLALAGLSLTMRLPDDRLTLVAAVDVSESIDARGREWQREYLRRLAGALAPGDELGVVAFARDAVVVQAPGGPTRELDDGRFDLPGTATDIARGLETALMLFPPESERRVLLLTDGNETRGSSLALAERARQVEARVYVAVPPHAGGADVAVEKLVVPPLVAEGIVFPLRVTIRNRGKARPALLELFIDDERIGQEEIPLENGLNSLEIPYRLQGVGSHRLRAQVRAEDDVIAGNDYREMSLVVGGKLRLLFVGTNNLSPLVRALERKDFDVTSIRPRHLPGDPQDLLDYHALVLEDVSAAAVSRRQLHAVERYVRDYGGGLLVAAGERTYADVGFRRTALRGMLPVTLEPKQPPRAQREPLALFLLIDRSNSMGYHFRRRLERSEGESKLIYARQAALAVVGQLRENDMVGVIAFDSLPFEVSPLMPVQHNRADLQEQIPRLRPGGGTDFYDALASARDQLSRARTNTRHIILLTDGETNRTAADHDPLIDSLANAGISATTIRVGHDTSNVRLLQDIAKRTHGQFYHAEDAATLPELMLKDTSQALAQSPRSSQRFAPILNDPSPALTGIAQDEIPPLQGYAFVRPKKRADVPIQVLTRNRRDPILASWQYGLGRVVAFTASPKDDAETWIGWEGLGKFWSQVTHWTVREQAHTDYAIRVRRADRQITLIVDAFGDVGGNVLLARLEAHPERTIDVTLLPHTPRRFVTRIPPIPGGRYPLTIVERSGKRNVRQRTQMISVPGEDEVPQEEYLEHEPNLRLLNALTAATGGRVNESVRDLVARRPGTRLLQRRLEWLLVPLAMVLFLADVGGRRWRR